MAVKKRKSAKRKTGTPRKKHASERSGSDAGQIRVRMYRQGFGDCFLVSLPSDDDRPFFMLIDCGVLQKGDAIEQTMKSIARDVAETTGGQLDLLVATHEHWDHVSGFAQAKEVFAGMTIDQVWLAWTENPEDEAVKEILEDRRRKERAVRLAYERLHGFHSETALGLEEGISGLLEFTEGLAAYGDTTAGALDSVRKLGRKRPRYLRPRRPPITLPGVDGIRIYVLGPPEDKEMLKKTSPTRSTREIYHMAFASGPDASFCAAVEEASRARPPELTPEGKEANARCLPFDPHWQINVEKAKSCCFFGEHYFEGADWRQIEEDWLYAAGELAIKLDSNTNNSSLVLAIECISSGKVLLFTGDAQIENWLSWHDLSWYVPGPDGRRRRVKAADLLSRTVLYKVGHHGSHNATLRNKGLEMMDHPDLVAMIPVDREVSKKRRWKIPFKTLLDRLYQKAEGRVLLADEDRIDRPENFDHREWDWFKDSLARDDGLYVEYSIDM